MSDAPQINFELLSTAEIENIVDKGFRHKVGVNPFVYLKHWLYIARHFGFATHDDSWGEFEKCFAVIIKRLVVAEREREAFKASVPNRDLAEQHRRALVFAKIIADLALQGEKRADGSAFEQEPDDAIETVTRLIQRARVIAKVEAGNG